MIITMDTKNKTTHGTDGRINEEEARDMKQYDHLIGKAQGKGQK